MPQNQFLLDKPLGKELEVVAWNSENTELLITLWNRGKTASEIARIIGDKDISRNAVIGKIHSLRNAFVHLEVSPSERTASFLTRYDLYQHHAIEIVASATVGSKNARKTIIEPPCWRLRQLAEFFFSKKINEEIFTQMFNDVQIEYTEAIAHGEHRKAKWIHIRGYYSFLTAVIALSLSGFVKTATNVWKSLSTGG